MSKWSQSACDRLLRDVLDPIVIGEKVTIEGGHEMLTVVGFELDGECVKLHDGKETFTVYRWRLTRHGNKPTPVCSCGYALNHPGACGEVF